MSNLGYLIAGWAIVLTVIAVYATRLMIRGRALSERVPEKRRRWMTSDD